MNLIDDAPWRPISPAWAKARRVSMLVWFAGLLMGSALLLWALGAWAWVWAVVLGPLFALGVFQVLNSGRLCRARRYAETADELLEAHGLLRRSISVVPYGRLQSVDVTQGPFERMFGLATVQLQTSSLVGSPTVAGLDAPEAHALAERLSALAKDRQWSQ